MRQKWLIYILLTALTSIHITAQEVITGLSHNIQLVGATTRPLLKGAAAEEPVQIPFIDDFSGDSLFPSTDRWSNILAFINNTFSVRQPSQGVATLDCLDERGLLYDGASQLVFAADSLTSRAINLEYLPSDSIWLSFMYEAGGIADMPESDDSLTLRFWAPGEEKWYSIWHDSGGPTDGFRRVMIPVKDSRFLMNGFRFMFMNHASLADVIIEPSQAGNADQWNIDHVFLDKGRRYNDTVLHDVALTLPQRSLLKEYEAMPWRHFKQAYLSAMSPTVPINYRNNDTIVRNVTRQVSIKNTVTGVVVRDFNAGASNVSPLSDVKYDAPLLYTYDSDGTDSALFEVTVSLITDDFDPKGNDTIRFMQRFTDYFAIDDGTAEAGYGINGQGSRNAMAALRFRSFIADSVTAINICFNDAYNNQNQRGFEIMVWADDNGQPGVLLGSTDGPVAVPGIDLNGFMTYTFDTPVRVTEYFWIGWRQDAEIFINAGLDMNTLPAGRQYYMLSGIWQASLATGTIMMRPVMKGSGTPTSSDGGTLVSDLFYLFPNPSTGEVTLVPSDGAPDDFIIDVVSSSGAMVMSLDRTYRPDLVRLSPGNYMLLIRTREGRPISLLRLIIVK
jgi:hypothetical protein